MRQFLFVAMLLITVSFSFAQEEEVIVKYRQKTVLDFEDVMLEGQIKKPTGSFLMDRAGSGFNSLIKMKENFNKELVRSVNLVK